MTVVVSISRPPGVFGLHFTYNVSRSIPKFKKSKYNILTHGVTIAHTKNEDA